MLPPYTVNTGESAVISFTTPEGYEAAIEASDKYTVDLTAGTITIDSVTEDMELLVLYRKVESDSYTVTVLENYADGSQGDRSTEHIVARNAGFYTILTIPTGYEMSASTADATLSVNATSGALHIASVTQDVLIEVVYTPNGEHTITIVERYEDDALPERTETYTVTHGDSFFQQLEVLDGYEISVVGVRSTGVVIDVNNQTISIDSVDKDYHIDLLYYSTVEVETYTVTIVERYDGGSQPDKITEQTVDKDAGFYKIISIPSGYFMEAYTDDVTLGVNASSGALHIAKVSNDVYIEVTFYEE